KVPIDSKLSNDEEKVLKEATKDNDKKKDDKLSGKQEGTNEPKKEKKGFLRRLFGGKDKKEGN
ncbi:MAG TPA: hypothetical protein VNV85_07060, partial [Puia sp.]|nr:hypothetical protein [Puia sp.]